MKTKNLLVLLLLPILGSLAIQPARASADDTFYGVVVSRESNYLISANTALPFEVVEMGLSSMWDENEPTKIKIQQAGVYLVGGDFTTLGLNYAALGGTDASRVIIEIVKNWCGIESVCPHLYSDVIFERFEIQNMYGANGNSPSSLIYLEAGDELEVLITGKGSKLLIECNPGACVLSPRFYAVYMGALP